MSQKIRQILQNPPRKKNYLLKRIDSLRKNLKHSVNIQQNRLKIKFLTVFFQELTHLLGILMSLSKKEKEAREEIKTKPKEEIQQGDH